MLNFSNHNVRIYAYTRATDMRKGFDGLSGIVRQEFNADPSDGSLFMFVNRRRDRGKRTGMIRRGNRFGVVPSFRTSQTDTVGVVTSAVYDKEGNVTKQFDCKGQFTVVAYYAFNRRKTVIRKRRKRTGMIRR